jgi:NTP pyrophosphatase (non-canonical NTP hydrolase)
MKDFNYIELAGRTNNPDYDAIKSRLKDNILKELVNDLKSNFFSGKDLDLLKKHIFYGRLNSDDFVNDRIALDCNDVRSKLVSEKDIDILHAVLGIATESSEIVEAYIKHIYEGKPLDIVNLSEEIGDVLWYCALILKHAGKTFEDVQLTNIKKLAARFPNGFTDLDANVRDLITERKILEE